MILITVLVGTVSDDDAELVWRGFGFSAARRTRMVMTMVIIIIIIDIIIVRIPVLAMAVLEIPLYILGLDADFTEDTTLMHCFYM